MKVISIKAYRILKNREDIAERYEERVRRMDKASLLNELLSYNDRYQKNPDCLLSTLKAQRLMHVLDSRAELGELRELTKEFQEKLKVRLYAQMQKIVETTTTAV